MFEDVFDDEFYDDPLPDYPAEPAIDEPYQRGPAAAVLWGVFLGCSWTWIIGMVFPALLLRDYGIRGWVAFAVPNVLGAAAMGTVLFKPKWSVDLVRKHAVACHNFSVVTVAYHLFVVSWLFTGLFGVAAVPMVIVAVGICAGVGTRNRNMAMLYIALAVTLISLGCALWADRAFGPSQFTQWVTPQGAPVAPRLGERALLYFLPCSVLGFLLCPYLDLTFHRARINTTGRATGPLAFVFGFGVVFFSMIVFSVVYADQLLPFIRGEAGAKLPTTWLVLLGIHLTVQAAFTITIHTREALEDDVTGGVSLPWLLGACGVAILLGFGVRIDDLPAHPMIGELTWGEAVYRGFLLLYGTAFPGYVWLIMIPTRRPLTRFGFEARTGVYAISSALAFAFGWLAFVRGEMHLVPFIFVLFLGARAIVQLLPTQKDV